MRSKLKTALRASVATNRSLHGQTQRPTNASAKSEVYPVTIRRFPPARIMWVMYGEKYEQTRQPLGLTITVARQKSKTISELSFLAVHTATGLGKRDGISEIFACK